MKNRYLQVVSFIIATLIIPLTVSALTIETKEKSPHCPDKEIEFTAKDVTRGAELYWEIRSDAGEIVKAKYSGNPVAISLSPDKQHVQK